MSRFAGLIAAVQQGQLTPQEISERLKDVQASVREAAKDRPSTIDLLQSDEGGIEPS